MLAYYKSSRPDSAVLLLRTTIMIEIIKAGLLMIIDVTPKIGTLISGVISLPEGVIACLLAL